MKNNFLFLFLFLGLWSCSNSSSDSSNQENASSAPQEVTVYTHRHYETDQQLFDQFEKESGIKVNVVNASADELIQKMTNEGEQSPADVLITVDAGRLVRAKAKGLLQSIESATLEQSIPAHLRDADKQWFALTKRARVIAYHPDRVKPEDLSTYAALTDARWKGKVLIRSSSNIYNQSLMASIIANDGEANAKSWAEGMIANFARPPKGNDRDQVKAVVAGEGDVAVVNTYYIGKLLNSKDPEEVKVGESIRLFFPNTADRGSHINVSGIGVAKHAPHRENAIQLIEFLSAVEAQEIFAETNYEYPVNPAAKASELLQSWGSFKEDTLPLSKLGELNQQAVILFDQVGWK